MPMTKDEIDAVSIMLYVDEELRFSVLLTRGDLTKRMGSSEGTDRAPVMVTGSTDSCFADFMTALPDELLQQGGTFEDEGRDGARHLWRFEFAGGLKTLSYAIAYHADSASLPDEFADMVVRAELLTHAWYVRDVAEETGGPLPDATESPSRRQASNERPAPTDPRGPVGRKAVLPVPVQRERIALVVLLDLFALSLPYSFIHWLFVGGGERTGPPGGALVLFAIVEFVLLQIARWSPGYWLLGVSTPLGGKPRVDPAWPARESRTTLTVGIVLCALGAIGLTAWPTYHAAVPYFGLGLPRWISVPVTLIGCAGLALAGGLVLRLDVRGVWVGASLTLLLLLSTLAGWGDWPEFSETAVSSWESYANRPIGQGLLGLVGSLPLLVLVALALLAWGLFESWRHLDRRSTVGMGSARI